MYKLENRNNDVGDVLSNLQISGMTVLTRSEEEVVLKLELQDGMYNPYGVAHGGVIYTLADTAAGICAAALGKSTVSLNSNFNFLSAVQREDTLYAVARAIHNGKKTVIVEISIKNSNDKLVAKGTFAMYVLNLKDSANNA